MEEGADEGEGRAAERGVRVPRRAAADVGEVGSRDPRAQQADAPLARLLRHRRGGGARLRRGRAEALRPDAFLNLPHLRAASAAAAHQRLRWLPASAAARGGAAAVPAYGLLNLNAQHNVHVIHQRLQELKNSSSSPTKPPTRTPTRANPPPPPLPTSSPCSTVTNSVGSAALPPPMSCFQALEQAMAATAAMESAPCDDDAAVVGFGADKPQLDLKEFLQQIGVLKADDDGATGKNGAVHGDDGELADAFGFGGSGEFDWDALAADMSDIAGGHGGALGANGGFQMDDLHEVEQFGGCMPIPIWDI